LRRHRFSLDALVRHRQIGIDAPAGRRRSGFNALIRRRRERRLDQRFSSDCGIRRKRRQDQPEGAANAEFAADLDPALVRLDDLAHQRQADAVAAGAIRTLGLEEAVEHVR